MNKDSRIAVFGASGMLGSAIVRNLRARGYENIETPTHWSVELMNAHQTKQFLYHERPEYIFMTAGHVGGIQANIEDPYPFLFNNTFMAFNLMHVMWAMSIEGTLPVKKYCYVGSSCIYPRDCPQPMTESYLGTGAFEPTNEGYAIAKYAGVKLAQFYAQQYGMNTISPIPCNLYGTNDHYGEGGHVLASLVKRFVDAVDDGLDTVTVWGSGNARREFLHVDDAADAIVHLMENHDDPAPINVGSGTDVSILELAEMIAEHAGYSGGLYFDTSKPDGMPRKKLDTSRITALGWQPSITLEKGISLTIEQYRRLKGDSHE